MPCSDNGLVYLHVHVCECVCVGVRGGGAQYYGGPFGS